MRAASAAVFGCLVLGAVCRFSENACRAQPTALDLPAGVQDVLKLSRAGIRDDVILAQIKSGGTSYKLNADQIIYLKAQGVSQNVITALLTTADNDHNAPPAPAPQPVAPAPGPTPDAGALPPYAPPPEAVDGGAAPADFDYFQAQLEPYGSWINVAGVGPCWSPGEAGADPFWRPYFTSGHWVYTDEGWFWESDYPWGAIPFHYGRWFRDLNYGWLWAPGYDWAPAWVAWRYADAEGYCGWAPLPLAARFDVRLGLLFGGHVAVDVDFGLPMDTFVFVGYGHFWAPDLRLYVAPRERVYVFYERSIIRNGYRVEGGRMIVEGAGRQRMASLTHRAVSVVPAQQVRSSEEHRAFARRVAEHPALANRGVGKTGSDAVHPNSTSPGERHLTPYGERYGTATGQRANGRDSTAPGAAEERGGANQRVPGSPYGPPSGGGKPVAPSQRRPVVPPNQDAKPNGGSGK